MDVIIVLCIVGGLAWMDIIPVRYWVAKAQVNYEGNKTRLLIQIRKWFDDLFM